MAILLGTGTVGLSTSVSTGVRANQRVVVEAVYASYSIIGIGALTIVQDDSTTLFDWHVQNSAAILIPGKVATAIGQGCTVTLAGLATAIGKLVVVFGGSSY